MTNGYGRKAMRAMMRLIVMSKCINKFFVQDNRIEMYNADFKPSITVCCDGCVKRLKKAIEKLEKQNDSRKRF